MRSRQSIESVFLVPGRLCFLLNSLFRFKMLHLSSLYKEGKGCRMFQVTVYTK